MTQLHRGLLLCTMLALASPAARAATDRCTPLAGQVIDGAAIRSADLMPGGQLLPIPHAASVSVPQPLCRVVGTISTRPGEAIGIELWMPVSWNHRLEGVGSSGFGGSIATAELAAAAAQGFAAASTDTGHRGAPFAKPGERLDWAAAPVQLDDWGRDAIHLMTVAAKGIVAAYYAAPSRHAFFNGCSTGGAEAMAEAEFFPADYDGIHAGSPGMAYSRLIQSFLWTALPSHRDPRARLDDAALALLHDAVLRSCAAQKAVPDDRFLSDPLACRFDPARLACSAGQAPPACLSPPQVEAVRRIYAPVRNPRTGAELYPGYAYGGEADPDRDPRRFTLSGWYMNQDALAGAVASPLLASTVFQAPGWDWPSFDFDANSAVVARRLGSRIDATSPDLRAFAARGGKLILTQGWADAFNAPTLPIEYWNAVRDRMGSPDRFLRLYLVPGMGHCGGGPGPNLFGGAGQPPVPLPDAGHDVTASLVHWVEDGVAPASLVATRSDGEGPARKLSMQRPLCAYPAHAVLVGRGDPSKPESFACHA